MDALFGNTTHIFCSSAMNDTSIATRTLIRGGSTPLDVYDLERSGQPGYSDVIQTITCALFHEDIPQRGHLIFHYSDKSFIENVCKPIIRGDLRDIRDIARLCPETPFLEVCWFTEALIKAVMENLTVTFLELLGGTATVLHSMEDVVRSPTPSFGELGTDSLCALAEDLLAWGNGDTPKRPGDARPASSIKTGSLLSPDTLAELELLMNFGQATLLKYCCAERGPPL
ncbi:hypothetical protein CYLTODRAFT_100100 [Cylindrobasidium torrendii FP15055 ss-10]|uniref:Uncharacterized protein n=1 Tax=Cylindrobasidium torrendii FP15055 ss-10 TaxID=1314674 RepID=A0A0D7B4T3_9AGAR|nr:hypothetical protein CYLTODRAFT_100100 [Cylindrobasidium torrendii FP15055 ss-10]